MTPAASDDLAQRDGDSPSAWRRISSSSPMRLRLVVDQSKGARAQAADGTRSHFEHVHAAIIDPAFGMHGTMLKPERLRSHERLCSQWHHAVEGATRAGVT